MLTKKDNEEEKHFKLQTTRKHGKETSKTTRDNSESAEGIPRIIIKWCLKGGSTPPKTGGQGKRRNKKAPERQNDSGFCRKPAQHVYAFPQTNRRGPV